MSKLLTEQTPLPGRKDPTYHLYGKVPPQALEMEAAVLGACLLERDAFEQVMEVIPSPTCFYKPANQSIYEAACLLYNSGGAIDLLTVADQLRKMSKLEFAGNHEYLNHLTQSVLSSAHIKAHAFAVMEKFMQREMIRIASEIMHDAYEDTTDVFDLIDRSQDAIKAITDGIIGGTDIPVGITYMKMLDAMEQQRQRQSDVIGISSGYDELDRLTLGWQKTDLVILAARPSQGKTALAVNFAMNAKVPVLLFSLESTDVPLVRRMAAAKNGIPLKDIRRGCFDIDQRDKMNAAAHEFHRMPIRIDSKSRSLSNIKKVARKWVKAQRKNKPSGALDGQVDLMILIDYLQLMSMPGKGNREQEIATISRDLKELATDLEVPIIALSQLNRETEKTANKKPGLANLRESGALEQDANIVVFIWWEDTGTKNEFGEATMKTHLLVEKNRDGECGDVELKFNGDLQKWLNMEDLQQGKPASFVSNQFNVSSQDKKDKWDDEPF